MFARIVIVAGALLVFLGAGLRTWGAAYLRTEVVHDTAQHSQALVADGPFRYTRNPLYLANPADGGWNRRPGQPFRIYFSCTGKLDFCLSTDSSRRRIPAENPRGIISGILPSGPVLLARVKAARFAGKSRAPTGARPSRERVLSGCSVSRRNGARPWPESSFVWIFGLAELLVAITLRPLAALIAFPLGFLAHFLITRQIQKRRSP